jgi:hypothetical protein
MGIERENTLEKGGEQDPGLEEGERVDLRRDRGDSSRPRRRRRRRHRRLVPPAPPGASPVWNPNEIGKN